MRLHLNVATNACSACCCPTVADLLSLRFTSLQTRQRILDAWYECTECNREGCVQETSTAADHIIDALDMAADDAERRVEASYQPNMLMLGFSGPQFVHKAIADVRASDLEATLTTLPYPDALKLLAMVPVWLEDASRVELTVRVAVMLLTVHQAQLRASPALRPMLATLQVQLRGKVQALKNVMGYNLAGLNHVNATTRVALGMVAPPVKRKALMEP